MAVLLSPGPVPTENNDFLSWRPIEDGGQTFSFLGGRDQVYAIVPTISPDESTASNDSFDMGAGNDIVYAGGGNDLINGGADDDELYGDGFAVDSFSNSGFDGPFFGVDTIDGGAGRDSIEGGGGNDQLNGGDDADEINGWKGADVVHGNDGDDTLSAFVSLTSGLNETDADRLFGDDGNDTLYGGRNNDILDGGAGNDNIEVEYYAQAGGIINVAGGADTDDLDVEYFGNIAVSFSLLTFSGTGVATSGIEKITFLNTADGNDTVTMSTLTNENVSTGAGNDRIIGADGDENDRINIDDTILTGAGNDTVLASGGNDFIRNDGGTDSINAGAGSDRVIASEGSGGTVDLGTAAPGETFSTDLFWAESRGGSSTVDYKITARSGGHDLYVPAARGIYVFFMSETKDEFVVRQGQSSRVNFFGITEADAAADARRSVTIDYANHSDGVTVDLAAGEGSNPGQTFQDVLGLLTSGNSVVDNVSATDFDDYVTGDGSDNELDGNDGDDTLNAGGGEDLVFAGEGSDEADGGAGDDELDGEAGDDTLAGGADRDNIDGGEGDDVLLGGAGNDLLEGGEHDDEEEDIASWEDAGTGVTVVLRDGAGTARGEGSDTLSGIESLSGSAHADRLTGDAEKNSVLGAAGNDSLEGGAADDFVDGGRGNDRIGGGIEDDILAGGLGNDTIDGGAGLDVAVYADAAKAVIVSLLAGRATGGHGVDVLAGLEGIIGSDKNDTLTGAATGDTIKGGDGNDQIDGGAGANDLDGGDGSDTLRFDSRTIAGAILVDLRAGIARAGGSNDKVRNIENAFGGARNDDLRGNNDDNRFLGLAGADTLAGLAGDDTLDGGDGIDTGWFAASTAKVRANLATGRSTGDGDDRLIALENLVGSNFDDVLGGNGQANAIAGRNGKDTIAGGVGNDTLKGEGGVDSIDGGIGNDSIEGGADGDTLRGGDGLDVLKGGAGNDRGFGGALADQMLGEIGDDTLNGEAGADLLIGGAGKDTLLGGAADDTLFGDSAATLDGKVFPALAANDVLNGGAGTDTASYVASPKAIVASLQAGIVAGEGADTLIDVENLAGGRFADRLTGDADANQLGGFAGNDTIVAGAGNDTIIGSAGADSIDGGNGFDTVICDSALRIQVRGLPGNVLEVVFGSAEVRGDTYLSIEKFEGSPETDRITGTGTIGITFFGGGGDDIIVGGGGDDRLSGDLGRDSISGLAGDDYIDGGAGNDVLTGGAGRDRFAFVAPPDSLLNFDRISDFVAADDTILLENQVYSRLGPVGFLSAARFHVGAAAATAAHRIVYNDDTGALFYDANGSAAGGAIKFAAIARGLSLTAADFMIV